MVYKKKRMNYLKKKKASHCIFKEWGSDNWADSCNGQIYDSYDGSW
ncbi:hypothetical protein KOY_04070 [Bacillus cereus VDM021]|nr:hypothetical protein IIW_00925 [Bacillus cereus VD136]EOP72849.1 hypothetical protein KOW_00259 [Bacillus cereus VDM006]EOQ10508.1 hypothetical protein KOY_04070 [Bacillus cereus VDM021]